MEDSKTNRLEDVADLLHEDILDIDSDNDKNQVINKLIQVEGLIEKKQSLELERLKLEEEKKVNENKANADARKLDIEAKRIEYEKPPEKTKWDKFIEVGKAYGPLAAAFITAGGVIIHEVFNRKNLGDVTLFEETGTYRSTGFRKWIK